MLQNNPTLKANIDQLWNKFWSGGISNPLTAIEQITYLLFMKRLDELDQKQMQDVEFTGEDYHSRFEGVWVPPEYRSKETEHTGALEKIDIRAEDEKKYGVDILWTGRISHLTISHWTQARTPSERKSTPGSISTALRNAIKPSAAVNTMVKTG